MALIIFQWIAKINLTLSSARAEIEDDFQTATLTANNHYLVLILFKWFIVNWPSQQNHLKINQSWTHKYRAIYFWHFKLIISVKICSIFKIAKWSRARVLWQFYQKYLHRNWCDRLYSWESRKQFRLSESSNLSIWRFLFNHATLPAAVWMLKLFTQYMSIWSIFIYYY